MRTCGPWCPQQIINNMHISSSGEAECWETETYQAQGSFLSLVSSSNCLPPKNLSLPSVPPLPSNLKALISELSPTLLFLHQQAWPLNHPRGQPCPWPPVHAAGFMHGEVPPSLFQKCNEKEKWQLSWAPHLKKGLQKYCRFSSSIIKYAKHHSSYSLWLPWPSLWWRRSTPHGKLMSPWNYIHKI